ncbi:MAG TPA: thioredoxin-like domain-containing protein [Chloroflexota bacterium]|nr:thioredoxin-like domain-containing protein [Chloroflexota bacterium]
MAEAEAEAEADGAGVQHRFPGEVNAPEFPAGLEWINTDHPLRLADLRGKLVLLDFWTFCCINCLHVLPQLRALEQRFADRLVVIGVHSAKFPEEHATAALRQAVRRHAIHHPVVNDRDFRIWREYAIRAWPTLTFVDPRGKVIARHEGEFEAERLAVTIEKLLAEFDAAGWLRRGIPDFGRAGAAAQTVEGDGVLAFPGKVLVDGRGRGHITIADSNHHRLVVMGLAVQDGAVHHVVGGGGLDASGAPAGAPGESGFVDGPPETARFNWPQGMAIDPRSGVIYIADTENHAIRRMSPDGGRISTIAGTGKQARRFRAPGEGGEATATELSSPWDVAFLPHPQAGPALEAGSHEDPHDDRGLLFIAMAGTHQIWVLDLERGQLMPFAGTGREALVDGPRETACFAQPSGLALDPEGRHLYVADSETSAVREIDLGTGAVTTLLGAGLFEFGDVDGGIEAARLQHPLGLVYRADDPEGPSLLVADTYNHRLKRLDLARRTVRSFAGAGAPGGYADGAAAAARFSEPGGLSLARNTLVVADTNNHRVRVIDLAPEDGGALAVRTLEIDLSRHAHAHEPAPAPGPGPGPGPGAQERAETPRAVRRRPDSPPG